MIVETLCAFLFLVGPERTAEEIAPVGWLARVRHYSREPIPQWKLTLGTDERDRSFANVWWVTNGPLSPDRSCMVEAKRVELRASECPAVERILEDLRRIELPADTKTADPIDRYFVVEFPDRIPIELHSLPENDPLVRWARDAWDDLRACAEVP